MCCLCYLLGGHNNYSSDGCNSRTNHSRRTERLNFQCIGKDVTSANQDKSDQSQAGSARTDCIFFTTCMLIVYRSGLLNRIIKAWHGRHTSHRKNEKLLRSIEKNASIKDGLHYDKSKKKITAVLQKNGGGNRLIAYADADRLKLEDSHGGGLSVVFLTKRHWMTYSTRSSSLSLSASV